MGIVRRKEFLPKNINRFFHGLFPAEVRYARDHPALCGKIIPQSGKNLPTFGISSGKKHSEWMQVKPEMKQER
jgi:hypothetical protein